MAGAAAPQSQPQPPSAEEEALKMNTDCVYFLASPLTCKKGSECEYRHSDFARVNPRDCWFWLNSNCLNPKCGFRHPPLDGLMGAQIPTPTGSAQPLLPQTATAPPVQVLNANNTQGVPCKFFQSGFCLKGDWCPFLHAPNSMKNKALVVPVTASATEPSKVEMPMLGKKVPPTSKGEVKPIKQVAGEVKPDVHIHELSRNRRMSDTSCINELPDYNCHPVSNGNIVDQFISVQQPHLVDEPGMIDNKDVGDVSREPSPGFDVLVDDEGRDSDFYHNEDRYGMPRDYDASNEYDIDHLTDYNMIAEADNDRYQDCRGYDSQGYPKGQYGLERNRASPERMSAGSYLKRRPCARAELDLRHRLARSKQPHVLRSVISHDQSREKRTDDHSREDLWRHERHVPRHDNFLSNRLQGRIRLPRRSSSPIDREMIRRADNGRLSSRRARLPSNQGRIQDRIKARVENTSSDEWKNHRGPHLTRDMINDNNADFAGPKSLAELKNRKNAEPSRHNVMDQQQLGKRKYSVRDDLEENGGDFSFEGPKPLEEILKQKRGERFGTISRRNSSASPTSESVFSVGKKEGMFERTGAEENGESQCVASKLETENGAVVEESEAYEQREEFNKLDGGAEFDMYDGDNGDGNGNGDDEDEEFAKKMGVVYS